MGFIEVFGIVTGGVTLWGAIYTYASRKNGLATRALVRESDDQTRALIRESDDQTRALIRESDDQTRALIRENHKDTLLLLNKFEDTQRKIVDLLERNGHAPTQPSAEKKN